MNKQFILIDFTCQLDDGANRDMVSKKINCIRAALRKELKKVESSKTSEARKEDIYVLNQRITLF